MWLVFLGGKVPFLVAAADWLLQGCGRAALNLVLAAALQSAGSGGLALSR